MDKKLILITSQYRSRGTWLYNVIRILLIKLYGQDMVYGCYSDIYDENNHCDFHVVKTHEFLPNLLERADLVLSSSRDISGIIESFERFHGITYSESEIMELLVGSKKSNEFRTDLHFQFDEINNKGELDILFDIIYIAFKKGVFDASKSTFDWTDVLIEVDKIPVPEIFDTITLLHPKHRNDR